MKKKFYTVPVTDQMLVNTSEMMETDHVSNPNQGQGSGTSSDPSTPLGAPKRVFF